LAAHPPLAQAAPESRSLREQLRDAREAFRQVPATFRLVWRADRGGTAALACLTAVVALLPAAVAWVGKLIVDAVVAAAAGRAPSGRVAERVLLELALMTAAMAAGRLLALQRELLRARLGNTVNELILQKALELELRQLLAVDALGLGLPVGGEFGGHAGCLSVSAWTSLPRYARCTSRLARSSSDVPCRTMRPVSST
jgi:hypothetical protein